MLDIRYIDKDIDIHIGMRVGINSMQCFYSMIIILSSLWVFVCVTIDTYILHELVCLK